MPPTTLKLRLDTAQLEEWKRNAAGEGLSLSEWVRKRCDGQAVNGASQPILFEDGQVEEGHEVREPEDVRRDRELPAVPGRAAAAVAPAREAAPPSKERTRGSFKRTRKSRKEPEESTRNCTQPVGPGIYCPKCGKRH